MASSDNFVAFEPCTFRNPFADSWFTDAIAHDSEVLTRALQESFSGCSTHTSNTTPSDTLSPVVNTIRSDSAARTPTVSGLSGSDHAEPRRRSSTSTVPVKNGKISKRKSRATKKSQTTFITADPANFRQMVQQVTGANFGISPLSIAPVLKPEHQRPVNRSALDVVGIAHLPTLDTSAFLLDQECSTMHHQQQEMMVGPATTTGQGMVATGSSTSHSPVGRVFVPGDSYNYKAVSTNGYGFEAFPIFPTLESCM